MKREDLDELIRTSVAAFDALSPEEQAEMRRQQRESWVRGEMSWPQPKFRLVDGTKVYESFEDYCND